MNKEFDIYDFEPVTNMEYLGWLSLLTLSAYTSFVSTLDNGLARTPPMGFMTWERFRCTTNCTQFPDQCISERLIRSMADMMVMDGWLKAGYKYIIIDDCWMAKTRDTATGRLRPNPDRFPSGIKALADYVHSRGLKFGIYCDYGTHTCAGYPGSIDHLQLDATTFAQWGVDYIKMDGCNAKVAGMELGYAKFGKYLNQTGRPIVFSCSWPAYQIQSHIVPNATALQKTCNLWRPYGDIQDSWASVLSIINTWGQNRWNMASWAGPGHWNDPDMIIAGDYGLSINQQRAQAAIWAIVTAPLLLSTDLRRINPASRRLMQNPRLVAINQDSLGLQGIRTRIDGSIQLWRRQLSKRMWAIAILNTSSSGMPIGTRYTLAQMLNNTRVAATRNFALYEVFDGGYMGSYSTSEPVSVRVDPGVFLFLAMPK